METINHESYVSLDVAKLLKKAGFDWKVISYYRNGNDRIHFGEEPIDWNRQHSQLTIANDYSAPTLEVAQRWLREVKNIDVFVLFEHFDPKINGYTYEIRHKGTRIILSEWVNTTYEGALEAGINKALEIILEKGE